MAALRIFVGLILFSNGLAKLFEFRNIDIGPYHAFLINRDEARTILDFEVNRRGGGTDVPLLDSLVNDVFLSGWDGFQWLVTALELGAGAALIIGIASAQPRSPRSASNCSSSSSTSPAAAGCGSSRTSGSRSSSSPSYPPAGRGALDRRLAHRGLRRYHGWPF